MTNVIAILVQFLQLYILYDNSKKYGLYMIYSPNIFAYFIIKLSNEWVFFLSFFSLVFYTV